MIQARFLVVVVVFIYSSLSLAENVSELGAVKVIGSSEAELVQPNSAHFISKEQLEQQQQSDVTRILKQVPGVYVQEEDGFGLRPNIGLRGTHPHRSRKVVILEDGILIGPAPYSAPAAYYTPFMSKIESLEVFKGVASVSYGPNSIGGAINYLTRSLPAKDNVELELAGGSYNTQKYRALVSTVWEQGRLLLEGTRLQTDGYKKLDTGRDTGFAKNDFLLKGEQRLPGDKPQALEWKVGYATELSDETYLGLSLNDFDTSPYRRYAASENDLMDWQHQQYQLSYKLQALENWGVWTTLYHHKFHRDWSRLNNFRNTAISISDVLKNPTAGANQLYYDILTGAEDSSSVGTGGDLVIVQNNRYFISQGIQLGSFSSHTVNDWTHNVTLGARLHEDEIRRYHTEETHSMVGGHLERTADARTYTAVNKDKSHVITLTAVDEIHWNALKITLASRFENIRYNTDNDLTGASSARSENIFVPGAGVLYQFNDSWTGLVGVNRGYTVSGPSAGDSEKPEESINYEAGFRYSNTDYEFFAEGLYFLADYQNIKGTCSFSAGCTSSTLDEEFDGGKALIQGIEMRLAKGFTWGPVLIPVHLNATLTSAEFAADSTSTNPEWGTGDIKSGDPLPYVPQAQYSLSVGTQYRKFSQEVILSWTGKMYDQSVETDREIIPAYGVVDWTMKYQYDVQGSVYARVDNILGNDYLVSLRPFGARPGKARSLLVGIRHAF